MECDVCNLAVCDVCGGGCDCAPCECYGNDSEDEDDQQE